jgi:diketogulonate reductase-like aldo/keto reductase
LLCEAACLYADPMNTIKLASGEAVPQLGQGTWQMGDDTARRSEELKALRTGLDLGLTLVDTAEMYGEGLSEELVAEAIEGRRNEVFLVSKVYPHNASRTGVEAACHRSLKRLKTDRIDLYLLHWMGRHPLAETVAGFEALQRAGKIRHWGVSNLDSGDMTKLLGVAGGGAAATNQILYNLTRRGVEWELRGLLQSRGIPIMAYSPVEQARLLANDRLIKFSARHGMTPAQAALAWLLAKNDVIVIPKSSNARHVAENAASRDVLLSPAQLNELDVMFPGPTRPTPLDML